MKILFISDPVRVEKYKPKTEFVKHTDYAVVGIDASADEIIAAGKDADVVVVDAIKPLTRYEIEHMPKLKLIHSEGVAYNKIDTQAAKEQGIYVCNQKGANAVAVAEQTVLLMLALLRHLIPGYDSVKAGHQIETKMYLMSHGIYELNEMKVGLIGFGHIGQEVARLLQPFAPEVYYYKRHRLSEEQENAYSVSYLSLDELLKACNIISMHVPVTAKTTNMCDQTFFENMQDNAYFINTARGEIVDNQALVQALESGKLAGVGLDTLAPEPVQKDNPLLHLPINLQQKVIISPHIGGCTSGFFRRANQLEWENARHIAQGERPVNIVNGL
ncbi:MAG: NAD(P)-dependent oxidoreductase [Absicoccus porci]|uniref:NAD(P)-dependent oxidoreductase n=1 Tax=Absicoccus porci TaxID=2486576 RepID=UPI00240A9999|nr:NAD(P)-dependent oxidoreductase [Absicoccus porci]MDD6459450.1 NAD(P)-dependent oxidoreductase [Absicoccus porci]